MIVSFVFGSLAATVVTVKLPVPFTTLIDAVSPPPFDVISGGMLEKLVTVEKAPLSLNVIV